jgi:AcrR family transcriptional regulator
VATGRYSSPRRAEAAALTRATILTAARRLYTRQGYANVTVAQIAGAAGVAVQTVYSSTGGKADILRALLTPAIRSPYVEQTLTAVAQTQDPGEVVDLVAHGTRQAHEANWDLLEALVPQCHGEPAAAAVLAAGNAEYLAALAAVAARLARLRALRSDVDETRAVDLLWFYVGGDAWFSLVSHRHWSFDDAERWLAREAKRALLASPGS